MGRQAGIWSRSFTWFLLTNQEEESTHMCTHIGEGKNSSLLLCRCLQKVHFLLAAQLSTFPGSQAYSPYSGEAGCTEHGKAGRRTCRGKPWALY